MQVRRDPLSDPSHTPRNVGSLAPLLRMHLDGVGAETILGEPMEKSHATLRERLQRSARKLIMLPQFELVVQVCRHAARPPTLHADALAPFPRSCACPNAFRALTPALTLPPRSRARP